MTVSIMATLVASPTLGTAGKDTSGRTERSQAVLEGRMAGVKPAAESNGESSSDDGQFCDQSPGGTSVFLTNLLNKSTAGVALFDKNLRCRAINAVLGRMIGVSVQQYVGEPMQQVFQDAAPKLDLAFRHALRTGNSLFDRELTAPTSAGARHWLVNFYPVRDELGQVQLVAATFFEITHRRNVETKLGRMRDKFASNLLDPGHFGREFSELSERTFEIVQRSVALLQHSMSLRSLVSEARLEARLEPLALFLTATRQQTAPAIPVSASTESDGELLPLLTDEAERPAGGPSLRERQVLCLLAEGKSNKEIAVALDLGTRTVETYRARIMLKLDLHSTAALVRYAIRQKFVEA